MEWWATTHPYFYAFLKVRALGNQVAQHSRGIRSDNNTNLWIIITNLWIIITEIALTGLIESLIPSPSLPRPIKCKLNCITTIQVVFDRSLSMSLGFTKFFTTLKPLEMIQPGDDHTSGQKGDLHAPRNWHTSIPNTVCGFVNSMVLADMEILSIFFQSTAAGDTIKAHQANMMPAFPWFIICTIADDTKVHPTSKLTLQCQLHNIPYWCTPTVSTLAETYHNRRHITTQTWRSCLVLLSCGFQPFQAQNLITWNSCYSHPFQVKSFQHYLLPVSGPATASQGPPLA